MATNDDYGMPTVSDQYVNCVNVIWQDLAVPQTLLPAGGRCPIRHGAVDSCFLLASMAVPRKGIQAADA